MQWHAADANAATEVVKGHCVETETNVQIASQSLSCISKLVLVLVGLDVSESV